MKKYIFLFITMICICPVGFAQVRYQGDIGFALGPGVGKFKNMKRTIEFETVHGVRILPYLFCGIGLASQKYEAKNSSGLELQSLPIFVNAKGYLLNRKFTPYLSFDAGYAWGISDDISEMGIYLSPRIGVDWSIKRRLGLFLDLGMQFQNIKELKEMYTGTSWASAFVVKIGFRF